MPACIGPYALTPMAQQRKQHSLNCVFSVPRFILPTLLLLYTRAVSIRRCGLAHRVVGFFPLGITLVQSIERFVEVYSIREKMLAMKKQKTWIKKIAALWLVARATWRNHVHASFLFAAVSLFSVCRRVVGRIKKMENMYCGMVVLGCAVFSRWYWEIFLRYFQALRWQWIRYEWIRVKWKLNMKSLFCSSFPLLPSHTPCVCIHSGKLELVHNNNRSARLIC